MKKLVIIGLLLASAVSVFAQYPPVHVNGYYRSNGTYVAPHYRTAPNSFKYDNYSYRW